MRSVHVLPWTLSLAAMSCTPSGDDPVDTDRDAAQAAFTPIEAYDPLAWVDPKIGTGGVGAEVASVSPGASWPNGMTLVGADTSDKSGFMAPFYVCAGYHDSYDHLRAVSLVHPHGMGVVDGGAVPFVARDGWDPADVDPILPVLRFDKQTEEATAGRWAGDLPDEGVAIEAVATERGAHMVFRFDEGTEPVVELDLGHLLPGNELGASHVTRGEAGAFSGEHRVRGSYSKRFGGARVHFAGQFDPAPSGGGVWTGPDNITPDGTEASGEGEVTPGAWWTFPAGTREVHLRVAVSYTDVDGAKRNLEAELGTVDIAARQAEVEQAWRDRLSSVRVRGGTDRQRRVFHSAMYRSLLMPSRQDDVDGRYRGVDQAIHTTDHPYYSDFSLWDTFRTVHPWYLLAWPSLQADMDRSLLRMTRDGGSLPRWPKEHGYTGGMIGTPAIQVLAESWHKGVLSGELADEAIAVAIKAATTPQPDAGRRSLTTWTTAGGWIPIESGGGAVSHALEYAWSDAALASWLRAVGRETEADTLAAQANNWRNHWDPVSGFLIGRFADGAFRPEIQPYVWSDDYVEGNAWHYVWMVPWDVPGLIDVQHGGDRKAFVDRLDAYWQRVFVEEDDLVPDDDYWHGNEPVMTNAFLASLAGAPDLTADASRWILEHRYDDTPEKGLDGNDDAGTLAAWATWSAIGLFPIAGFPDLVVGSPVFERVEIDRGGDDVVIVAPGASEAARYVGAATLDGAPLTRASLRQDELVGAELVLTMSEERGGWQVED